MNFKIHLTFQKFTIRVYLPGSTFSVNYIFLKNKFHCVVRAISRYRISDSDHYVFMLPWLCERGKSKMATQIYGLRKWTYNFFCASKMATLVLGKEKESFFFGFYLSKGSSLSRLVTLIDLNILGL